MRERERLLLSSAGSLFLGIFLGGVTVRTLYGDSQAPIQLKRDSEEGCTPCPPIDAVDVQGGGVFYPSPDAIGPGETEEIPRTVAKSGLPARALKMATDAVLEEIAICRTEMSNWVRDTLVLELTVTATVGAGFIREVHIVERSKDGTADKQADDCILGVASRTRFVWAEGEGESKLRIPVRLGR